MVAGVAGRLHQFLHRRLRGGDVRVAETQVDDVLARPAGPQFQIVDLTEHIGRHPIYAPQFHGIPRPVVPSPPAVRWPRSVNLSETILA